jgi:hypothetical protein
MGGAFDLMSADDDRFQLRWKYKGSAIAALALLAAMIDLLNSSGKLRTRWQASVGMRSAIARSGR